MNLLPQNSTPLNQQKNLSFTSKLKPSPIMKAALTPPFEDSFVLSKAVKIILNDGKNDVVEFAGEKFNSREYKSLSLLVNGKEVYKNDYNRPGCAKKVLFDLQRHMEAMLIGWAEKISDIRILGSHFTKEDLKIIEPEFKAYQKAIANLELKPTSGDGVTSNLLTDMHIITQKASSAMHNKLEEYGSQELARIKTEMFG